MKFFKVIRIITYNKFQMTKRLLSKTSRKIISLSLHFVYSSLPDFVGVVLIIHIRGSLTFYLLSFFTFVTT